MSKFSISSFKSGCLSTADSESDHIDDIYTRRPSTHLNIQIGVERNMFCIKYQKLSYILQAHILNAYKTFLSEFKVGTVIDCYFIAQGTGLR